MINNIYNNFFGTAAPSAELEKNTLREMKKITAKRRRGIPKRALTAVVSAAAVFVCGVSAAALGGLLDFETVFGGYVKVNDSELADSLMGTVSGVKYKVSDNDYKITVKGVMGDGQSISVVAEISRADGTPVTEHFPDAYPSDEKVLMWLDSEPGNNSPFVGCTGGSRGTSVNSDGNIDVYMDTVTASGSLDGQVFTAVGKGLVPADDIGTKLLDLDWELSFRYHASEASLENKVCVSPGESFAYYADISEINAETVTGENENSKTVYGYEKGAVYLIENTAVIKSIEAGSMNGRIEFEYPAGETDKFEFDPNKTYLVRSGDKNEIYLILSDGSRIPAMFSAGSETRDLERDVFVCGYSLAYTEDMSERQLADMAEITSIYINGTVYELQ